MASPNLGSVAGGMADMTLDLQAIQMNQFKLAEAPIQLQQDQIKLQQDKLDLQQRVKLLSLMQNIHPPKDVNSPDAIADTLTQVAAAEMASGNPDAAGKFGNEAAGILEKTSLVDSRTYRMQNDRMSKFANILSQTPDTQQGFTQAIQAMLAADPGVARDPKFQSLAKQGWQPGLVPKLERSVLTAKEQAEVDYKKKQEQHLVTESAVGAANISLDKVREKHIQDADAAKAKEGGTVVKASDRNLILKMAEEKWPGADANGLYYRAQAVAEEMVKLQKQQPALEKSEAASRAFQASVKDGRWDGIKMTPVRPGTTPEKPMPWPGEDEKPDGNMWYDGGGGEVRWLSPVDGQYYSKAELLGMQEKELADIGYGGEP